jgi:tetratricopeptide (TPR) repeat protein
MQHEDPFALIYALRRGRQFRRALGKLVDLTARRLNPAYRWDANHAWYCVGDLAFQLKEVALARDAFRRALRSRPDDVEALWALGNCYTELLRPRLAERCFRRALALDKDSLSLRYNLANALYDQKQYQLAMREFRKVGKTARGKLRAMARRNELLAQSQIAMRGL